MIKVFEKTEAETRYLGSMTEDYKIIHNERYGNLRGFELPLLTSFIKQNNKEAKYLGLNEHIIELRIKQLPQGCLTNENVLYNGSLGATLINLTFLKC